MRNGDGGGSHDSHSANRECETTPAARAGGMAGDAVEGAKDVSGGLESASRVGIEKITQEWVPGARNVAGSIGGKQSQGTGRVAG